jgi:hypothetical protein
MAKIYCLFASIEVGFGTCQLQQRFPQQQSHAPLPVRSILLAFGPRTDGLFPFRSNLLQIDRHQNNQRAANSVTVHRVAPLNCACLEGVIFFALESIQPRNSLCVQLTNTGSSSLLFC